MKIIISLILICFSFNIYAKELKVGVTAGPHAIIMEEVKKIAAQQNLQIKIIEFNDFIMPNIALSDGEIDINSYQHQPFLFDQVKTRGFKIKSIGKTILMPIGLYSKKIKEIQEINDKVRVAIPNDPTNSSRALLLLQNTGLISLKTNNNPSILDIRENYKKAHFIEVDAPSLPRILEDVDLAVINTDWILLSGLNIEPIYMENPKESPYVNVLVVRSKDEHNEDILLLKKIYQSDEIKRFIEDKFQGKILAGW